MMVGLDAIYPQYGFAVAQGLRHARSTTRRSIDYGPSPIHRRSFEPVRVAAHASRWRPESRASMSCSSTSTCTPSIRSSTASCAFTSEGDGAPGLMDAVAAARHAGGRAHRPEQSVRDGEVLSRGAVGGREADHRRRPAACASCGERAEPSRSCCCVRTTSATAISRDWSAARIWKASTRASRPSIAAGSTPTTLDGLIALSGAREGDLGRAIVARPRRRGARGARQLARAVRRSLLPRAAAHAVAKARSATSAARSISPSSCGVPVVATNDVRFIRARGFRGARGARLHSRRHAARRSEAAASLQRSSSI